MIAFHIRRFLAVFFLVSLAPGLRLAAGSNTSPARTVISWDEDWRFSKISGHDFVTATAGSFDDSAWRTVRVPHDWSTEEPFLKEYASGTGFAAGGIAWYRKHFKLENARDRDVTVEFDGVYANSEIWLNGQYIGGRPYGYSSFGLDLTRYLNPAGTENVLAVRVDHSRLSDSRFYTGSGIYRHVRLVITDPLSVARWGTFVSTISVDGGSAKLRIETAVQNNSRERHAFVLQSDILDESGRVVASVSTSQAVDSQSAQSSEKILTVNSPHLWSLESPSLYSLRTRVIDQSVIRDETLTSFGIRTFSFDPDHGFSLNGKPYKLKGVCLHHDGGSVGAAVPIAVWERRLQTLKKIGVNAIRTSHNPPAPELLDLCDHLGFLVEEEALDEFTPTKNKWVTSWSEGEPSRFGAGEFFAEWATRDVTDMVRRDRNHPSIVQWSIGNEIDTPNDPFSDPVLEKNFRPANPPATDLVVDGKPLVSAVKAQDSTRPVTAALASVRMSDAVGFPGILDIVGYNYQEDRYSADHAKFPHRVIFGSENSHSYSAWIAVRDHDYISGQFLWTGVDYLGEARKWPSRANTAGLLDLCGWEKPLAYFRQSLWSDQPMVYLCVPIPAISRRSDALESWNWKTGETVDVACYSNCAEIELFLNGRSLGTKQQSVAVEGVISWKIPFEPGILLAVARSQGRELARFTLRTAGAPDQIAAVNNTSGISAQDGEVSQLELTILDAQGTRVPDGAQTITLDLSGPAELLGFGNADASNTDNARDQVQPAFRGRALAIIRRTSATGSIMVKASSPGLKEARVTLLDTTAQK